MFNCLISSVKLSCESETICTILVKVCTVVASCEVELKDMHLVKFRMLGLGLIRARINRLSVALTMQTASFVLSGDLILKA